MYCDAVLGLYSYCGTCVLLIQAPHGPHLVRDGGSLHAEAVQRLLVPSSGRRFLPLDRPGPYCTLSE